MDETQICNLWNWVRDTGVFTIEDMPEEYNKIAAAFLELLKKLECVTGVFVSGDGVNFSKTPNGFQYIAD